jgi:Domain of unknown function (DUF4262)
MTPEPDSTSHAIDIAIARFGWAVVMTDHKDGFAYTVGLNETHRHAELCVHGLRDPERAIWLLDLLAQRIGPDGPLPVSTPIGNVLRGGLDVVLLAADDRARELAQYARARYGAAFAILQCVLPDAKNRFPWQYGVDRWQTFGQIVMAPWPQQTDPRPSREMLLQLLNR